MTSPTASATSETVAFGIAEEALGGGLFVVAVRGELDLATAPELRRRFDAVIEAGATAIVVDLAEVSFVDSVSLAAILNARKRLEGGRLSVVALPDTYASLILEVAGVDDLLGVVSSRDAAIARVRGSSGG